MWASAAPGAPAAAAAGVPEAPVAAAAARPAPPPARPAAAAAGGWRCWGRPRTTTRCPTATSCPAVRRPRMVWHSTAQHRHAGRAQHRPVACQRVGAQSPESLVKVNSSTRSKQQPAGWHGRGRHSRLLMMVMTVALKQCAYGSTARHSTGSHAGAGPRGDAAVHGTAQ